MSRPLRSFADLVLQAQQGEDYDVVVRERGAAITVLALHGGHIEPLTGQLASAIAGEAWNLYLLRGLRPGDGQRLRLPTLRLAEVRCDALLAHSELALAVTGCDAGEATLVGGSSERLTAALLTGLTAVGLPAAMTPRIEAERLPLHCYNRGRAGGAQLTLPAALRRRLVQGDPRELAPDGATPWTAAGEAFITAVQQALAQSVAGLQSDLAATLARFERTTREMQERGILGGPHRHRTGV